MANTGRRRVIGLIIARSALAVIAVFSVAVGSRYIPPSEVLSVLFNPDDSQASTIVHGLRVPRTALGVAVGMALGMAGAVMQALTRNPLADPGLLGVNAGAAVAVVIGISVFGVGTALGFCPSPSSAPQLPRWWCTCWGMRGGAAPHPSGSRLPGSPSPPR